MFDGDPLKDLSLLTTQGRHMPLIKKGVAFVKQSAINQQAEPPGADVHSAAKMLPTEMRNGVPINQSSSRGDVGEFYRAGNDVRHNRCDMLGHGQVAR